MSTTWEDIRTALDTNLATMASVPPLAGRNLPYTPVVGTLYVRMEDFSSFTRQAGLGSAGIDENREVYTLNVFSQVGFGSKEATEMADLIATQFSRGTVLTSNGVKVRIINVDIKPGRSSGGWYQVPIDIFWNSFTAPR